MTRRTWRNTRIKRCCMCGSCDWRFENDLRFHKQNRQAPLPYDVTEDIDLTETHFSMRDLCGSEQDDEDSYNGYVFP